MPILISQDLYLSALNGDVQPLTHPRICYQSYLDDATITSGAFVDGYPIENILTGQTFEVARSSVASNIVLFDLGYAKAVDYFACVGKQLNFVSLSYSDDGITYTTLETINDSSQKSKIILFEEVTARYWKAVVSSNLSGVGFDIINMKLGKALAMYRPIYGGHSPINLNRVTVKTPNFSEGGEFLGRSVVRRGFSGSFDFQHLPASWYRTYFDPFVQYAETGTFYIAWRPADYPLEVSYGLSNDQISPSNMGVRDLMQVSFNMVGYDAS